MGKVDISGGGGVNLLLRNSSGRLIFLSEISTSIDVISIPIDPFLRLNF